MSNETSYDTLFGKMAVDQGLCTQEELKKTLQKLKARMKDNPVALRDLMITMGVITKNQALRLHTSIKENKAGTHQIPGYKVLGKVGAGAMAVVYKAKQISLDRTVAINASVRIPSMYAVSTKREKRRACCITIISSRPSM